MILPACQEGFNAALPAMGLVLIIVLGFFFVIGGFNAALPAMGLVFYEVRSSSFHFFPFQCCFACNGFSMLTQRCLPYGLLSCFNAALPAMGLVYYNSLKSVNAFVKVSMLLCLQWV